MSVDVEIIPTSARPLRWGDIKHRIDRSALPPGACGLLGAEPCLHELGTHRLVPDHEPLTPPHYYYFRLAQPNTLSLAVERNEDVGANEHDVIDDFGRNLSQQERRALAATWHGAGLCYVLESTGGRHLHELPLFIAIATSIAHLCGGRIIISDSGIFSLGVGIYRPEQFCCVVPIPYEG